MKLARLGLVVWVWVVFSSTLAATFAAAGPRGTVITVPGQYPTIKAGLAAAIAGDTVQVAAGTYAEGPLTIPNGVRLVGAGWQTTIIQGSQAGVVMYGSPQASLEGFTVQGSGPGYFDAGVWVSQGPFALRSVRLTGNSAGVWGWCFDEAACALQVRIESSVIDNNSGHGVNSNNPGVFWLVNNTIVRNGGDGVILNNPASRVENNLIIANQGNGLANPAGATVQYNDVWSNGNDYAGGSPGAGGWSVDPLLHSLENGDFHLYAGSPVIGAGNPAGTPPSADLGALPFAAVGNGPTGVMLARVGETSWQVSWTGVARTGSAVAGYAVYHGPCTRETTARLEAGLVNSLQIDQVTADQMAYVAVSAYDAGRMESPAAVAGGLHWPCPPAPGQLEAGAFPGGQIRLQWQDLSSIETGYTVERSTGALTATNYVEIASLPGNTSIFTDTPPLLGDTYWYRVQAHNANGASPYSNASYNASFDRVPNLDEQYLLVLINEARAAPGKFGYPGIAPTPPLRFNPLLAYAAHSHSQAILNSDFQIGHCDPIGRCPSERAHAVGFEGGVAENLIAGMDGPAWVESSHQAFMDSQGHRDNLLCPCFNEAGLGHTYDPAQGGDSYWKGQYTETFCGREGVVIPNLPAGIVVPYRGTPQTDFTYIANYYHPDGLAPQQALVYIDGVAHAMQLSSGTAANGTYRFTTRLGEGRHQYYFAFSFSGGSARLPQTGSYPHPQMLEAMYLPVVNK